MDLLIAKTAAKARHTHHHVAIVVKGGAVRTVGFNHDTIHAEVAALSKLWPNQRPGCKVWSIRVRKNGTYGLARPCDDCMRFLVDNGVKVVYYSNNEGGFERLKL